MRVVVVLAAVVFFFFDLHLLPEEAGYAGSWSRPPWVRIYCPQIVDNLVSRRDILEFGLFLGLLSTKEAVCGATRFLAE